MRKIVAMAVICLTAASGLTSAYAAQLADDEAGLRIRLKNELRRADKPSAGAGRDIYAWVQGGLLDFNSGYYSNIICVWDAEADALKTLEVDSGFSAAYRGEQIPTLEEMLACARGRITLMIELKYTGQEDALEESVLTLLQDYDMVDECIIGSMNKGILQKMKELEPGISTVFIAHDLEEEDYELDYADSYSIEGRNLTVDMVDAIHYCGKSVYGWTANTSGAMLWIVNCGADGVITDDVRLLQTFLREQACRKAFASVY